MITITTMAAITPPTDPPIMIPAELVDSSSSSTGNLVVAKEK